MPVSENQSPLPIDHPTHAGWLEAGLQIYDITPKTPVPEPFERFGRAARQIMHAVNVASRRHDSDRDAHERQNVAKLLLSDDEYEAYLSYAGDTAKTLEYIKWFGPRASRVYRYLSEESNFRENAQRLNYGRKLGKITLELFGQRQGGWWSTKDVDTLARQIPSALEAHGDATIETFDDPKHPNLLGYKFLPLYHRPGERKENFKYGTVWRSRILADIVLRDTLSDDQDETVVVELYKESTAMVVVANLTDTERAALTTPYEDEHHDNEARNSPPAKVAGEIFETGIAHKDDSMKVIPLGIQNMMQARAPESLMKQFENWRASYKQ